MRKEIDRLDGVRACVFDAYGTLFDVHSAAAACRAELGDKADPLSDLWRRKQLEYTWLRSLMRAYADFDVVTAQALDHAMAVFDMRDDGLRARLLELYRKLQAYPEVSSVLRRLRDAGLATAILSNGSPSMLDSAVSAAGLAGSFDHVLSVAELGVYKPDPAVYRLAADRLGAGAGEICFLSSNGWDARGAAWFGFQTVWVNRFGQAEENLPGDIRARARDLNDLPPLLGI